MSGVGRVLLSLLTRLAALLAAALACVASAHAATTTAAHSKYGYDRAATFAQRVSSDVTSQPRVSEPWSPGPRAHVALRRSVLTQGFAAEEGAAAARLGQTVSPLGRTYEAYDTYLTDVARHYGINLRGVSPVFDYSLSPGVKGLTRASEGGRTIRINPGFANESDLANTLAHELSHARDFQKGLSSAEAPAYASGNALEEWINGLR